MMMCAFRYALGRRTYIVGHVVEQIIEHKEDLGENLRGLLVREIDEAIYDDMAGDTCDVNDWKRLRSILEGK